MSSSRTAARDRAGSEPDVGVDEHQHVAARIGGGGELRRRRAACRASRAGSGAAGEHPGPRGGGPSAAVASVGTRRRGRAPRARRPGRRALATQAPMASCLVAGRDQHRRAPHATVSARLRAAQQAGVERGVQRRRGRRAPSRHRPPAERRPSSSPRRPGSRHRAGATAARPAAPRPSPSPAPSTRPLPGAAGRPSSSRTLDAAVHRYSASGAVSAPGTPVDQRLHERGDDQRDDEPAEPVGQRHVGRHRAATGRCRVHRQCPSVTICGSSATSQAVERPGAEDDTRRPGTRPADARPRPRARPSSSRPDRSAAARPPTPGPEPAGVPVAAERHAGVHADELRGEADRRGREEQRHRRSPDPGCWPRAPRSRRRSPARSPP